MPTHPDRPSRTERHRHDFWDQASHDLRQPVQSLQLLAGIFSRHADVEPVRQAAEHMRRVADDLGRMHEALVLLSRLECGHSPPQPRTVAVAQLASEILRELSVTDRERPVALTTGGSEASVEADPALLALTLRNLIVLALRHCDGEEITIDGRMRKGDFSIVIEFPGPPIPDRHEGSVFVEAGEPEDRRAILGPGYLQQLCRALGYRLDLNAGRGGKQRFRLTIPASPARA